MNKLNSPDCKRRLLRGALALGSLMLAGCATAPDVLTRPVLDRRGGPEPRSEVSCSPRQPRTGVTTLSWESDRRLEALQRLDVTALKHGFDRDAFVMFWPLGIGARPKRPATNGAREFPPTLLSLEDLRVTDVTTDDDGLSVAVRLEGTVPGVNYYWRVLTLTPSGWLGGEIERRQAPVCVADHPGAKS